MVGIGIIGCGQWGANYLRNFLSLSEATVLLCCDQNASRINLLQTQYPMYTFTTEWQKVLEHPGIQGVVVATPAATHYQLTQEALNRGKHVLVEKPVTLNWPDTKKLVQMARGQGLVLMAGHIMEYHPAVEKLKEFIASDLGALRYLYFTRTNLGVVRADVNVLWDLAIHDIALLRFLVGSEPKDVAAQGGCYLQPGLEDVVFITIRFPEGVLAQIHASWLDPSKIRKVTVIGEKKMLVFDDIESSEKIRSYDRGINNLYLQPTGINQPFNLVPRYGDIYIPSIDSAEPLKKQCQQFLEAIQNGSEPRTGYTDALWVMRVASKAQESLKLNGQPLPFGYGNND